MKLQKAKADLDTGEEVITRPGMWLGVIFVAAFLARLLVRTSYGEEYFWKHSYSLFFDMAKNIAAGRGLLYEWVGTKVAQRPPVYPLFLALSIPGGHPYITIVTLQSLIGAGTAICTILIGRQLFDNRVGFLAGLGVAFYPYFVMHDTALQETGLFTFLTALAVLLLLRSKHHSSVILWATAGLALGLAVLTRATLLVFVPFAFLWVLLFAGQTKRVALRKSCVIGLAFLLLVVPWILRNQLILGTPTFSTLTGLTLWAGNNPFTFAGYPTQSIDLSVDVAMENLRAQERNEIQRLSTDEIAQNSWFLNKALDHVKNFPVDTLVNSLRKIGAAFSWRQNPQPGRFAETVYLVSYFPVLVLGLIGILLTRENWKEQSLVYMLFLSFIGVTAIFFAHTSHRIYLDVYLILFSAKAAATFYRSPNIGSLVRSRLIAERPTRGQK